MSTPVFYEKLFPTYVVYSDNEGIVTEEIIALSKRIVEKHSDVPFFSPCYSTVNTFTTVLDLPQFVNIRKIIVATLSAYLDKVKIKNERLTFSGSWLNLYKQHGYQDLHLHSESLISGVFYIESAGNSDLMFQSPYHFYQSVQPDFEKIDRDNCCNVKYESKVGRCFIFPSHLMHRTLPAISERVSLSFNVVKDAGKRYGEKIQ
jgi:uncharacterized protein (TIGR02466 family)